MREKTVFICNECGYKSVKWLGRCTECGSWNSFVEQVVKPLKETKLNVVKSPVEKLVNIKSNKSDRIVTNISEFNRVTGGGLVRDSVTILTSPPGGGKSTLSLTIANNVASQGYKVIYATGEESDSQIRTRADRILDNIYENIWILADTRLDDVVAAVDEVEPDLIIIDSIQTFTLDEFLPARAGNPTQTMGCASTLVRIAKNRDKQRAVIIIGQMNKNDEIAGLRALEHLVDTVLVMEGESEEELRSIVATKNRFGSTGEMGFFSMTEKGLLSIDNPSEFFITKRKKGEMVSGSALTVVREGSRPIIAEIESLVSNSFTPYPLRIGEALRREQLNILISILEQRCGINFSAKNVVIKTTGGIKLKEQSVNLAVLMSIASSFFNKPIPAECAFISEVGLTGELKKVPALESRIKELDRMGFEKVFIANGAIRHLELKNLKVIEFNTLNQVIASIFRTTN